MLHISVDFSLDCETFEVCAVVLINGPYHHFYFVSEIVLSGMHFNFEVKGQWSLYYIIITLLHFYITKLVKNVSCLSYAVKEMTSDMLIVCQDH